ncbi:BLUF domain-containing protein [Candidatus Puniceispirillum sp.]|nr:BLUF domain-containing protein [Candidatus Puniceispirillum sp.]
MQSQLKRVVYVSKKTDVSDTTLKDIITSSKKNNPEEDVTGCLLSGSNSFLQLLEGPADFIDTLYSKISKDNRHENVVTLCDEKIDERLFLSWSMKLAPFENMEWSNKDFNSGNFLNITSEEALNVFFRLNEYT